MKQMFKNALLMTLIGSVVFLSSCVEDDDPEVVANFNFEIDTETGGIVTFNNLSSNAEDYEWNFGDGTSSTSESPSHTYLEDGDYTVVLTASNASNNDTEQKLVTIALKVDMTDTQAPVITLEGAADLDINLGDTFTDEGATALDDVDGDVDVTVAGDEVNTEVAGTYVITYDASDAAGNAAEQVTRTVRVRYPSGLLMNGDFQGVTMDPWTVNFGDGTVPVEIAGTNTFFIVNIETASENAFDVNLSQEVTLEASKTYKLSFNASSDVSRNIIAGIGQSADPFGNSSATVDITTTETRYELVLSASFVQDGILNRVLFDLAGATGVVVLDNITLEETDPVVVDTPAPTDAPTAPPARDAADVISIYGEAYGTAVGLNNVDWDEGSDASEESHAGNNVLKLSFNTFLGTDLASETDASGMTHVHMDLWIADDFAAGQVFLPKWSNHNGGGETDAFEYTFAVGGDDSKKWLSIDVPLSEWNNVLGSGPDARANLKQLVIGVSATLDVVYLDNVYFYNDGTGGGTGSEIAPTDAPTAPPTRDAADVISIYGEAYGTAIGLNNVDWDEGSDAAEETHADNNVLKLNFNTFLGTDLGSETDASGMTHIHMDFWIADDFAAGQVFLPKWSNHNGGGETDAFEYTFAVGAEDSKKWLSIDIPVADWSNVAGSGADARANLKQLVIGVSATLDVVYMDNIYFYKN